MRDEPEREVRIPRDMSLNEAGLGSSEDDLETRHRTAAHSRGGARLSGRQRAGRLSLHGPARRLRLRHTGAEAAELQWVEQGAQGGRASLCRQGHGVVAGAHDAADRSVPQDRAHRGPAPRCDAPVPDSIMVAGGGDGPSKHILHPLDRTALFAVYSRVDPRGTPDAIDIDLGPWDDTSTHLYGVLGTAEREVTFGAAFSNGRVQPLQFKRLYGHKSLSPGQRHPDLPRHPQAHRAGTRTSRQGPSGPPAWWWCRADGPGAVRRAATARACSPSHAYPGASLRRARGARPLSAHVRQTLDHVAR